MASIYSSVLFVFLPTKLLQSDSDEQKQIDREVLHGKIHHTLHGWRDRRCQRHILRMLHDKHSNHDRSEASVHTEHTKEPDAIQDHVQALVWRFEDYVTLGGTLLADAIPHQKWENDHQDALAQHGVRAQIHASLGPHWWISILGVHLEGAHPCSYEKDTQHRSEIYSELCHCHDTNNFGQEWTGPRDLHRCPGKRNAEVHKEELPR